MSGRVASAVFVAAVAATLCVGVARAQYVGGGSIGAGGSFSGTLFSSLTFDGVTDDITTAGNEELTITTGGSGDVVISKALMARHADTPQMSVGTSGNGYFLVNTGAASSAPNIAISAGRFGGDGALDTKLMWKTRAKVISTTDTTTQPSHHFITVSATGVSTWTPSETNAVDGECFRAVNTGSNSITMTESSGVYEGTCALGQYDAVTACYITDRWVQVACSDN